MKLAFLKAALLAGACLLAGAAAAGHTGKKTYNTTCGSCHHFGVSGAPRFGDQDDWKPRIAQGKSVLYQHAIRGFRGMPAKGANPKLTDEQVRHAVDYMVREAGQ